MTTLLIDTLVEYVQYRSQKESKESIAEVPEYDKVKR
jgi:hypothetical protein